MRVIAPALLVSLGAVLLPADGRALVVDDFESGGLAIAVGCPPTPGSYLTNVETELDGALGGRRSTLLAAAGPLPTPCPSETEVLTFGTAELITGAEDDGLLFRATNNITSVPDGGPYLGLKYRMPDFAAFDLTDAGASDTLQIEFSEVGGPFILRISAGYEFGARGYGRFDFDSPGVLSIPLAALFHTTPFESTPACTSTCPDLSRLEFLSFDLVALSGAQDQRLRISDIRSVPEPATATLLLGGLAALGARSRRISRRAGPAPPCR